MKTARKITALLLSLIVAVLLAFPTMAAPNESALNQATPNLIGIGGDIPIQPFYANIVTTYLSHGSTWICADVEAKSRMNLRVDIKVYKNGVLDYSAYSTANNAYYCAVDVNYNFVSGVSYRIDAIYKAGTESVPKSMSFKAK